MDKLWKKSIHHFQRNVKIIIWFIYFFSTFQVNITNTNAVYRTVEFFKIIAIPFVFLLTLFLFMHETNVSNVKGVLPLVCLCVRLSFIILQSFNNFADQKAFIFCTWFCLRSTATDPSVTSPDGGCGSEFKIFFFYSGRVLLMKKVCCKTKSYISRFTIGDGQHMWDLLTTQWFFSHTLNF